MRAVLLTAANLSAAVAEVADGRSTDVVADVVGGETFADLLSVLRPLGRYLAYHKGLGLVPLILLFLGKLPHGERRAGAPYQGDTLPGTQPTRAR